MHFPMNNNTDGNVLVKKVINKRTKCGGSMFHFGLSNDRDDIYRCAGIAGVIRVETQEEIAIYMIDKSYKKFMKRG